MIRVLSLVVLLLGSKVMAEACVAGTGETAYSVRGMSCGSCEESLTKQFKALPQVAEARADHQAGCLVVKMKEGKVLTNKQVTEALRKAGKQFELANASGKAIQSH